MKKVFDISALVERLKSVNPDVGFAYEVLQELNLAEEKPQSTGMALRRYFELFISKSEGSRGRDEAIQAAARIFEVPTELAAKYYEQVSSKQDVSRPEYREEDSTDDDYRPTDVDIQKARHLVKAGEAKKKVEKDGPAANVSVKQPALDGEEKPDKPTKDLGDDQTLEPVDFKKKVSKTKQDTMTKIPDKDLGGTNQLQLYDGLWNSIEGKNLAPNLSIDDKPVDESKMGVDYVKSAKAAIKTAATALKAKDYDAAAAALEDIEDDLKDGAKAAKKMGREADTKDKVKEARMGIDYLKRVKSIIKTAVAALKAKKYDEAATALDDAADDAGDGARAAKKMKRDDDRKAEAAAEKEKEVEEAKDEVSEDGTIKKSDTDADKWNAKAIKKQRESLYICNGCAKTFRANESKCPKCLGEDVENITDTENVVDAGLMTEDEVQKLLGNEVTVDEEVVEEAAPADTDVCPSCGHGHMQCRKVTSEHECDACGVLDKREQSAKAKKANEDIGEEETDQRKIVGRGYEDRRDAEDFARKKNGTVVVDDQDEKKFMIIVKTE